MRLCISTTAGWQDVTEFVVGSVEWAGAKKQMARSLSFSLIISEFDTVRKYLVPVLGHRVMFFDEKDELIFGGRIMGRSWNKASTEIKCKALDDGQYLRNKVSKKFTGITAEAATKVLLEEFDFQIGDLAETNVKTSQIFSAKPLYEIIMALYSKAHSVTKEAYGIKVDPMRGVGVEVLGDEFYEYVLDGGILLDAAVSENAENIINLVIKEDKNGKAVLEKRNDELIEMFGLFQDIVGDKATDADMTKALKPVEQQFNVSLVGDSRLISGAAVSVKDEFTTMVGTFYVDADSHSFSEEGHSVKLTLTLENLMDEKEFKEEVAKKKAKKKKKKSPAPSNPGDAADAADPPSYDADYEYYRRLYGSKPKTEHPDPNQGHGPATPRTPRPGTPWSGTGGGGPSGGTGGGGGGGGGYDVPGY